MQGQIDQLHIAGRDIYVYTPPTYTEDSGTYYPAVYVQDGAYLFRESIEAVEADFRSGVTQEVIFIGIEPIARLREYSPWPAAGLRDTYRFEGEGDAYLSLVTETIMPAVKDSYRILDDAAQTGIAGASLGGLLTLYAAFQKPSSFGRFALLSPSMWYEGMVGYVEQHEFGQAQMRFYLYVGEQEGAGKMNVQQFMVPNVKQTYHLLSEKVEKKSSAIRLETNAEGVHDQRYFLAYFPRAMRFLYPRNP